MKIHISFRFIAAAFFAASSIAAAGTITFSDGTFNLANYSTAFSYIGTAGTTATYTQCASCGNPGQALALTITEPTGGTSGVTDVLIGITNSTFTYDPATQGAITSISASVDKDFTINEAANYNNTFRPLIEQDGNFYAAGIAGPPLTGPGTTGYNTLSNGALLATDFLQVNTATGTFGTANPNFAGDPMVFGLAQLLAGDGVPGNTALLDYDNLNLTLSTTPEPSAIALLGVGLAGLALLRRKVSAR
jgi:hypothetical protein